MERIMEIVLKAPLFKDISHKDAREMLKCLCAEKKSYLKDETVFHSGDSINKVGMVLSGSVHIIKEDFWGRRTILSKIMPGQNFAESYACLELNILEVSIVCAEKTDILFLDINRVIHVCSSACTHHMRLVQNLVSIIAGKNLMLTRKLESMSKRTIREKLLSYLSAESIKSGSPEFKIPFNRQELADYLSVDRSAMSNELSKLRNEEILDFHKNTFSLK